jgi:hypothetical protein
MLRHAHRRLMSVLIAILFAFSVVGHGFAMSGALIKPAASVATTGDMAGMGNVAGMGDMARMSDAAMDAPDHAMDCDGDGSAKQMACFATCASVIGILWEIAPVPVAFSAMELPVPTVLPLVEHGSPPDPYPPKRII